MNMVMNKWKLAIYSVEVIKMFSYGVGIAPYPVMERTGHEKKKKNTMQVSEKWSFLHQ